MALRAAAGLVNQIGAEVTPGTAVAGNRYTPTLNWNLKRSIETKSFRGRGSLVNTAKVPHKRMANGSVDGVLDYNSIIYLLSGIFNNPAPTQIGSLTAYQRLYTSGLRVADTNRKTYTVEIGDDVAAERYDYCQLLGLNIDAKQDDFGVKSDAIARYPVDGQVLTANPTDVTESPVQRSDINLYLDDSFADLGTTQVTEAQAETISLGSKFKEVFFHNRTAGEFADVVGIPYEAKFSFETAYNAQARTLMGELALNPMKWFRWEALGRVLGTNSGVDIHELIQIDMAVQFDSPEPLDNNGDLYAYRFNTEMMPDSPGLASFMKVKVINSIAVI